VICLAFAKGIIVESKRVKVNGVKFAKVTYKDQT
jgi:hypothetical protein